MTCDPDEFEANHFALRQNLYGRSTELFIAITMYNEDEVLFCRTLYGVMKNISHLCSRRASMTWGPDSWKKVSGAETHRSDELLTMELGGCMHHCRWPEERPSSGAGLFGCFGSISGRWYVLISLLRLFSRLVGS